MFSWGVLEKPICLAIRMYIPLVIKINPNQPLARNSLMADSGLIRTTPCKSYKNDTYKQKEHFL